MIINESASFTSIFLHKFSSLGLFSFAVPLVDGFSLRNYWIWCCESGLFNDPFSLVQVGLLSEDYGKHFLGVEDLLQKHSLVEADIQAQAERVKQTNVAADDFLEKESDDDGKYCHILNYLLPCCTPLLLILMWPCGFCRY